MNSLADLHRAVQSTLASKRLGQPVFVRYLWISLDQPETILPRLTHLTAVIGEWLGQPLERIHAVGRSAEGRVNVTLEYRNGASGLLSWARSPARGDGVDLMVLGNRGAIYHDAGSTILWEDAIHFGQPKKDAELEALLARALRSGKPEAATGGAKP